jgi:hypothetical protein
MHVRKTIAAAEFDLELTTENGGLLIRQAWPSSPGGARLATDPTISCPGPPLWMKLPRLLTITFYEIPIRH